MLRTLVNIASLGCFLAPTQVYALELGAGAGIITQGDDRLSPALHSWFEAGKILVSASLMGEKNSTFSQQIIFPQISYKTLVGKSKSIHVSAGVGGMLARTLLLRSSETTETEHKTSSSAGLAFGLHWSPALGRDLRFKLSWDSVFIPPGISVLYLTFGHMQSVTSGLGWEF